MSPAILMMQQNSRLALITLEVVRDAGLPTAVPLAQPRAPESAAEEEEADAAAAAADAEAADAATPSSAPAPPAPRASVDFIEGFLLEEEALAAGGAADGAAPQLPAPPRRVRGAAVRLLASFMGAALGSHLSAWAFVEEATRCYCRGWTADELFLALRDEEFAQVRGGAQARRRAWAAGSGILSTGRAQILAADGPPPPSSSSGVSACARPLQSGGVVPIGVASLPGGLNVSATLFARWLSVVYISLVQMGVMHPGATEQAGWAWVCSLGRDGGGAGGMEAHGVAEFVSGTLRVASEEDGQALGGDALGGWSATSVLRRVTVRAYSFRFIRGACLGRARRRRRLRRQFARCGGLGGACEP